MSVLDEVLKEENAGFRQAPHPETWRLPFCR